MPSLYPIQLTLRPGRALQANLLLRQDGLTVARALKRDLARYYRSLYRGRQLLKQIFTPAARLEIELVLHDEFFDERALDELDQVFYERARSLGVFHDRAQALARNIKLLPHEARLALIDGVERQRTRESRNGIVTNLDNSEAEP